MKIAFIDPQGDVAGFNAGIGYISSVLKDHNHEVRVLDFNNDPKNQEARLKKLVEFNPDIVGFSVKTSTLKNTAQIAQRIKSKNIRLIAGGSGITCEGARFLAENNGFENCFIGETEDTIIEYINGGGRRIKGLCYRDEGKPVCNDLNLVQDLDSLSFPDYSVFDTVGRIELKYPLVTSRGCPYDCTYCSVNKVSGRTWRKRSPENIVKELIQAKSRYNIKRFDIADDNFTMDIKRAKDICRLIINEKLGLKWGCINGIRADRVDEELLRLMKESGCDIIWLGIESLHEEIFDTINKGEKLEAVVNAVKAAKKTGMSVSGFFIAGLPGSTYKKDMETLKRAGQLKLDEALWSLCTPYPHTKLWEWAKDNARQLADYKHVSFYKSPEPVIETDDYSAQERLKMFYKGNLAGFSYSCFFPKKIRIYDILRFFAYTLKYDALHIFTHFRKIFFGRYHRKYIREFVKRFLS